MIKNSVFFWFKIGFLILVFSFSWIRLEAQIDAHDEKILFLADYNFLISHF
jgi:hypothetical protein